MPWIPEASIAKQIRSHRHARWMHSTAKSVAVPADRQQRGKDAPLITRIIPGGGVNFPIPPSPVPVLGGIAGELESSDAESCHVGED